MPPGHHLALRRHRRKGTQRGLDLLHVAQPRLHGAAHAAVLGVAPGDHGAIAFHGGEGRLCGVHVCHVQQVAGRWSAVAAVEGMAPGDLAMGLKIRTEETKQINIAYLNPPGCPFFCPWCWVPFFWYLISRKGPTFKISPQQCVETSAKSRSKAMVMTLTSLANATNPGYIGGYAAPLTAVFCLMYRFITKRGFTKYASSALYIDYPLLASGPKLDVQFHLQKLLPVQVTQNESLPGNLKQDHPRFL